jgi:hypothetical protein
MTEKTIEQQIDEKTEELRFLMAAKQKQDSGVAETLKGGYFRTPNGKTFYIKSIKPTSSGVHICEGVCFSDFGNKRFSVSTGFTIDSYEVEKLEKMSKEWFKKLLNECFAKYLEKTDKELEG